MIYFYFFFSFYFLFNYDQLQFVIFCDYFYDFQLYFEDENHEIVEDNEIESDFQRKINVDYCNQQGIENIQITIKYQPKSNKFCYQDYEQSIFDNSLKYEIFSLSFISFVLRGINSERIDNYLFRKSIIVHNFDLIELQYLNFFLVPEMYFLFVNQNFVSIKFQNIQFLSNLMPLDFKLKTTSIKHIDFNNLNFQQVNFTNTLAFNISGEYLEKRIYLNNIKISDCYFLNSTFIQILNTQEVYINNLTIENSIFMHSALIILQADISSYISGQLFSSELRNNKFYNSDCFQIKKFHKFEIKDISISECLFSESNLYSVQTIDIILGSLNIHDNFFFHSSIFKSINEQQELLSLYEVSYLNLTKNVFSDSFSFYIAPKYDLYQRYIRINFNNFILQTNQAQDNLLQSFLFYLHSNIIQVENIKIIDQNNISFLYIYETEQIQIQQLEHENSFQNKIIPLGQHCYNSFNSLQVLKVYGFKQLLLKDIQISRLNTLDQPIIEFLSNIIWNTNEIEQVIIQNITFKENILFKQNFGKKLSLIFLFSENRQKITLKRINFYNNLLHQTLDDSSDPVSGLIYIKSQQSNLEIFDFNSINNWITNSSSSFLFIEVDFLSIYNYKCENLNIFDQNFIQNYLIIPNHLHHISQEQIQLLIQKFLSIKTKGCLCLATVKKIQIIDGQFKKIFSKTSPLLEIYTQSLGQILLKNLLISQVDIIYESNNDVYGSIQISSSNSNLDLVLQNIEFNEVFGKFSPSIISIMPSQRKNKLIFYNITIINSISLKNQILKVEFLEENSKQNEIIFKNISIKQTEQAWMKYFEKIGQNSNVDLEKILNNNALINLANCKILFQSIVVEGIFISSIIRIVDSVELKIVNCEFLRIQIFYFLDLIKIEQNKFYPVKILMFKNQFQNIKLLKPNINDLIDHVQIIIEQDNLKCLLNQDDILFSKTNFTLNSTVKLFQIQQNQNYGSLLYIQSLSNQIKTYIFQLNLVENNCDFCKQGLIYFDITQIQNLQITQLTCIKNQILSFGCLNIQSEHLYKNQFQISNSIFALNQGQSGTGIFFSGLRGVIKNCLIFNNSAIFDAGGIMINIGDDGFLIKNTQIFQNNCNKGGGLVINSNSNINNKNFVQNFLLKNNANYLANNVIETPTQLNLQINGQRMRSNQQIFENLTENILKLQNYKIHQLDSKYEINQLLIPSNQKITVYKIFDSTNQVLKKYIDEISLEFFNSYQEKLGDLNNQNCTVYQNILHKNSSLINQSKKFTLYFNSELNKIDLGNLYFTFDPYEQKHQIQQIEIFCKINDNKALSYKINTKTFFCQLGEFYSQGGCQICEANYGFYSVTFNATKCSIFDQTKFKAITSNTISLLAGFWRPNYLSDSTEVCFKEIKYCLGEWKVGDYSCMYGHIGGLCEECDIYNIRGDGYFFKNPENTNCLLCQESKSYIIRFIFATLLAIFSILITLKSIATTNKLFASLKIVEKFGKIIFKLNQDHQSFLLKMFLNYLWIFSVIFTYNITFVINLNFIDLASNTSYFMANNLDCYISKIQDIHLIYIRIIETYFFIFIQIFLILLVIVISSNLQQLKFDQSNISNTCIYLYISNHASLTKQFCSLIAKRIISNISYVQGNVSLQFYSQSHQNWFYYFALPGLSINGCGIPLLLIIILYTNRNKLDQIKVRKHICYLFNEYNQNSYYWEQIKIWQKTVIILIITYFDDRILLKTTLLGLSLMFYQFLAIMQKPYIISNLNKLDIESGQICTLAIFLAAVRSESSSSNEALIFIQIIIISLCLILVYQFISVILRAQVKKYKIIILYYIQIFFKTISSTSTLCQYFINLYSKEQSKKEILQKNFEKLRQNINELSRILKFKQKTQNLISVQNRKKFGSGDYESINQFLSKLQLLES